MADSVTYEDIIRTISIVPAIAFLKKEKVDFPGADADRMIILEVEIKADAGEGEATYLLAASWKGVGQYTAAMNIVEDYGATIEDAQSMGFELAEDIEIKFLSRVYELINKVLVDMHKQCNIPIPLIQKLAKALARARINV